MRREPSDRRGTTLKPTERIFFERADPTRAIELVHEFEQEPPHTFWTRHAPVYLTLCPALPSDEERSRRGFFRRMRIPEPRSGATMNSQERDDRSFNLVLVAWPEADRPVDETLAGHGIELPAGWDVASSSRQRCTLKVPVTTAPEVVVDFVLRAVSLIGDERVSERWWAKVDAITASDDTKWSTQISDW